jgi:hypothetical protein
VEQRSSKANDASLDQQLKRLATERGALFDKAGVPFGLSDAERQRLHHIEREMDECFLARRRQRAVRDAGRFERDGPTVRRSHRPTSTS